MHLLLAEARGGLAENSLSEDGDDTAAGTLATVGADVAEVGNAVGSGRGRVAAQVSNTEDIGGTALGVAEEAVGAGRIAAAIGGDGRDGGGKEADDGDERGLHFEKGEIGLL
jgi:hypothetical protein